MAKLIPKHGGYANLKTFILARLIYDITMRFCDKFIGKRSRTHDQMVQAARSGVQNIAEGSQASGTSKKTEIKLTNVARASIEELRLDFEDYLRHNNLSLWSRQDPRRNEIVKLRFSDASQFARWVKNQEGHAGEIAANGTLVLIGVCCALLNRQVDSLADTFQKEGGFTEKLYNSRKDYRSNNPDSTP